jgi:hypothetical protein
MRGITVVENSTYPENCGQKRRKTIFYIMQVQNQLRRRCGRRSNPRRIEPQISHQKPRDRLKNVSSALTGPHTHPRWRPNLSHHCPNFPNTPAKHRVECDSTVILLPSDCKYMVCLTWLLPSRVSGSAGSLGSYGCQVEWVLNKFG